MPQIRRCALLVALLGVRAASADQSPPTIDKSDAPVACKSAPPSLVAEVERLLKSAGEHATRSQTCVDGDGEVVTIQLLTTCVMRGAPLALSLRYHVNVKFEVGGECAPYPKCAEPPPPTDSDERAMVRFAGSTDGLRIVVPNELPGVPLKTPLAAKHSRQCYGESAPFVARAILLK